MNDLANTRRASSPARINASIEDSPYLGVAGISLVAGGIDSGALALTGADTIAPTILAGSVVLAFVVLVLSFFPAASAARRYKQARSDNGDQHATGARTEP